LGAALIAVSTANNKCWWMPRIRRQR